MDYLVDLVMHEPFFAWILVLLWLTNLFNAVVEALAWVLHKLNVRYGGREYCPRCRRDIPARYL